MPGYPVMEEGGIEVVSSHAFPFPASHHPTTSLSLRFPLNLGRAFTVITTLLSLLLVASNLTFLIRVKMPCLRGIEVSLTTKPDNEQIPEYPHPEGASARLITGIHPAKAPSPRASNRSDCPTSQVVHQKAGPTVSVYIPSIPGRFSTLVHHNQC